MSTEDVTAEIAAVLAEHDGWSQTGPHDKEDRFDLVCYGCGDLLFPGIPDEFGEARMDELHRHHLADLLAARDRRVRAEALREAAEACGPALANEIGSGHTSTYSVRGWLRDRADRIEADA